MEPTQEPSDAPKKGYGKRPLWQWIVIYIIVAIIVYVAIYLVFFQHSGTTSTGGDYGY
jgi:hypothetical protein